MLKLIVFVIKIDTHGSSNIESAANIQSAADKLDKTVEFGRYKLI
jgi:hypothetical protein